MSIIVGLTGQTGAGKTEVSRFFEKAGYFVIDCDRVTRNIIDEDTDTREDIMRQFPDLFTEGRFDRRKAAAILFSDKELLEKYDGVIFPHITRLINSIIETAECGGHEFIMLDAPTLFEAGIDGICDTVIGCIAPLDIRLKRITARDGITAEQAMARISSQHDDGFFREHCGFVIENGGDLKALGSTAESIIGSIAQKHIKNNKKRK